MPIITNAVLVYLLATSPTVHVRLVDKMPSLEICETVAETIKRQEVLEPEDTRIGNRLFCWAVSYKYDGDGDGPSKVVAPPVGKPEEDVKPCRNPITKAEVACKEALYIQ